jgi:hypothetical protein
LHPPPAHTGREVRIGVLTCAFMSCDGAHPLPSLRSRMCPSGAPVCPRCVPSEARFRGEETDQLRRPHRCPLVLAEGRSARRVLAHRVVPVLVVGLVGGPATKAPSQGCTISCGVHLFRQVSSDRAGPAVFASCTCGCRSPRVAGSWRPRRSSTLIMFDDRCGALGRTCDMAFDVDCAWRP